MARRGMGRAQDDGRRGRQGASRGASGRQQAPGGRKGRGAQGGAGERRADGRGGRQGAERRRDGASRGAALRGPRGGSGRPGRARAAETGSLIEGRRAAEEALALGVPVSRVLLQRDLGAQDSALGNLAREFEMAGIEVERVPRPVLDSLSSHGAHQGIVLKTRPFEYAEVADVIAAAGEGDALVIVLDHVTDEGNFGAIVRSAEVVGAAGVVIAKARAASVGVGAYKTSAGAVMHLPIAQVPNLATALDELKAAGFWVAGATEHASQTVWEAPMGGRLALVMGSEGEGISRLVRERCDFECKLPQRGQVESLNVAQATTVLAYEWLRRTSAGEQDGELRG